MAANDKNDKLFGSCICLASGRIQILSCEDAGHNCHSVLHMPKPSETQNKCRRDAIIQTTLSYSTIPYPISSYHYMNSHQFSSYRITSFSMPSQNFSPLLIMSHILCTLLYPVVCTSYHCTYIHTCYISISVLLLYDISIHILWLDDSIARCSVQLQFLFPAFERRDCRLLWWIVAWFLSIASQQCHGLLTRDKDSVGWSGIIRTWRTWWV